MLSISKKIITFVACPGLPQLGKNNWKMKFFPGHGKVREFCGWSGKFRKDLESQGKVREFAVNGYGRRISENIV